ncbi:AAA family ATPase, partial [Nocardiopsis aegyptia]|uniref:AAA family ATPase n=1 Tax=Nocardiopsis aegyptia TaxID=220378 RepID=UPI00366D0320
MIGNPSGPTAQAHTIQGGVGNTTNNTTTVQQQRELPLALDAVPAAPDGFVGRGDELAALTGRLDPTAGTGGETASGAVVVSALAGMGGVGKTALAFKAAQVASASDWFCAHLFVDLHGYTPQTPPVMGAAALDVLLRQMGVDPEEIPSGLGERSAFYRSALQALSRADERGRPVLVVADNAHRLDQVRPLLPGPSRHRLLVTSRKALAIDGHQPLSLDTLSPAQAVELLHARLGPDDSRALDTGGLGELAQRCGYLPLALKIAAALMARSPHLHPGRLAARLAELSGFFDDEDDLSAVFAASVEHLPADRVRVFALLGSAPGTDISTNAAAALAGAQSAQEFGKVQGVLEELAAAHLITAPAPDRWAMHDLVAAHARTLDPPPPAIARAPVWKRVWKRRARPSGGEERDRALDRVLDFYTVVADAADDHLRALAGDTPPEVFSGREEALGWLDAEIDNLLACVRTAHHTRRSRVATRLPQILGIYLGLRRRFDDAIDAHTLALEAAHRVGDARSEASAWNNLGSALAEVRRFEEAINALTRARDLHHQVGDDHGEAQAW